MFRDIPINGLMDFAFADITSECVLTGVSPYEFATSVHAAMAVGWLHRPVPLIAARQVGKGRLLVSTLRLSWKEVGFGVVLFLARLMSVEEELFDAAKIDGANWWQLQRHITVPQLASVIEFFTVVSVITMLSWVFSYVFVMTGGGPGSSTMVTELYVYLMGFRYNQMSIAAAVSILLLLVTGVFIFL